MNNLEKIPQIIHNLQQISTINKVKIKNYPWTGDYQQKSIEIFFQIQGNSEEHYLFYEAHEIEINKLRQAKNDQELFELLIEKQLLAQRGQNLQDFQTPCPFCQQSTLNVLVWTDENFSQKPKRLYCRLCRVSMPYLELTKDPLEAQREMMNYEIIIRQNEIKKDSKKLFSLLAEKDQIETRIRKNQEIISKYEI